MPLTILCILMLVGSITLAFSIILNFSIERDSKSLSLLSILLILSSLIWIIVAWCMGEKEVDRVEYFTIHQSPDNYQYVTIDGKPKNVTSMTGKIAKEGQVLEKSIYRSEYGGITGFGIRDTYKIVDAPKKED